MSTPSNRWHRLRAGVIATTAVTLAAVVAVLALTDVPQRLGFASVETTSRDDHGDHDHTPHGDHLHDDHDDHDHGDHDHDDAASISLSDEARANSRLVTGEVRLGTFVQSVEVPAAVTAWPGRTHVDVTSPLTGVISSIEVSRGEMVRGGEPLFKLRLTHQDLVKTQEQFLTQLGQLDVEEQEIQRLTSITSSGAVAGKTRLTREYERDKLLASVRAGRQALLLHGLSEAQVRDIERTRQLVREVVVSAPEIHADESLHHDSLTHAASRLADAPLASVASRMQPPMLEDDHVHLDTEFLVTELSVWRGQAIEAGGTLARLSDYSVLLIEGHAFQRDAEALRRAAETSSPVQAIVRQGDHSHDVIDDLRVISIGNEIGRDSRTLAFFVPLQNEVERDDDRGDHRYVSWKYKPGQRMQLRLPVQTLPDVLVVPKDAVAEEGLERFVFVENGDHFDRVVVEIVAKDSTQIALAAGGKLWPGQRIAMQGAHQLQMEMKNRDGGPIDPHAGHNH